MMTPCRQRRLCRGQASVEYLVVLAFGVIVLLKPFAYDDVANPNAPPTEQPALQQLATAVKDYHKHYTYAMAIATIPDCDYQFAYDKSTDVAGVGTLTGSVTVGFDRCIDWTNPQLPAIAISTSLGLPDNVETFIGDKIQELFKAWLDDFLSPGNFLGDMLGFSPGDFF